jgi:phage-related protein
VEDHQRARGAAERHQNWGTAEQDQNRCAAHARVGMGSLTGSGVQTRLTSVRKYANLLLGERMPRTKVVYYREADGAVPVLEWLAELPRPALVKCRVKLERLKQLGDELRRPEADFLRDGIYELRVRLQRVNYRLLYFFHGRTAAVVSHGIRKEDEVPTREIEQAIRCKHQYMQAPQLHTFEET